MSWKDFFYYRKGERVAIVILLILIVSVLILNILFSLNNNHKTVIPKNEEFAQEFEEFQASLLEEKEGEKSISKSHTAAHRYTKTSSQKKTNKTDKAPSYKTFSKQEKLAEGEQISLNSTDTTEWKKIPGIGSSYAARIVKYRTLLGGFAAIEQLREVYGIDNEMYIKIAPFIKPDTNYQKITINKLEFKQLLKHPYLNYKQVKAIMDLRHRKGNIRSIEELAFLDEFSSEDIERLRPYLEF